MHAIASFFAGLGLFFCGVHFVSSNLVPLVGRRVRVWLMRLGGKPWLVAICGSVAGVVTQSTNAVTSVIIGLVAGGMIDRRRAILIPTWSNVGTSLLVCLAAVDFRLAASYLVALMGGAVYFGVGRDDRVRHAIRAMLGLGLLFLGIQTIDSGIGPLRDLLLSGGVFAAASKSTICLLLMGAGLSLACQSSSVAGALAVAATATGLIDLTNAAWLIYGANLGSAFNYGLLARTHRGEAAQIALMQVMQKIAGFAVVLVLVALGYATGRPLIEDAVTSLAKSPSGQVAWIFLFYQLAGSSICSVFVGQIIPLLARVAPPSELQELSKPEFLVDEALVDPSFAIELVCREERRLLERLPGMLDVVRSDAKATKISNATLRSAGTAITRAMAAYLDSIRERDLERTERDAVLRLQHRTQNLGAIYETLDEFVATCQAARGWPSSERVVDQMVESLHALLSTIVDATASEDAADRELMLSLLGHRDEMMERIRQRVLREDPDMQEKAREALFAATMLFERVIWLVRRSALLLFPDPSALDVRAKEAAA
jgi:phosphate:Na+ symporter